MFPRLLSWPAEGFSAVSRRAGTRIRWPMLFAMEPADVTLFESARYGLDVSHDYDAEPARVQRTFLGFVGEPPWSPGFLGVDWWTPEGRLDGAVMDELYAFMAMRVEVVEHEAGRRTVAYVSRWSLPFARRMVQLVETKPLSGGGTRLRYRVAYEPPAVLEPFIPAVEAVFRKWFELSLEGLERYLVREERAVTGGR
jgi:hypothetical protein